MREVLVERCGIADIRGGANPASSKEVRPFMDSAKRCASHVGARYVDLVVDDRLLVPF